jgi:hypothetical protein
VLKDEILQSLKVRPPIKTIYEVGEPFNPEGLIVIGVYSDGSEREEPVYSLSLVSTDTVGNLEVTVTVGEKR